MKSARKIYTSRCGKISCSLPTGLDPDTVAEMLTVALESTPHAEEMIEHGSVSVLGITTVSYKPRGLLTRHMRDAPIPCYWGDAVVVHQPEPVK